MATDLEKTAYELVDPKDKLDPAVWIGDELRDVVRDELMRIAEKAWKKLDMSGVSYRDIVLTGSTAGYFWSPSSDIDIHIIVDYDDVTTDAEVAKKLFKNFVRLWGKEHNIYIKGHQVELYVQDDGETFTDGAYSILNGSWIQQPNQNPSRPMMRQVLRKAEVLAARINDALDQLRASGAYGLAVGEELMRQIGRMRDEAIASPLGEMSIENLAFKAVRRIGLIEKLTDMIRKVYDDVHSIT